MILIRRWDYSLMPPLDARLIAYQGISGDTLRGHHIRWGQP